jgi:hypothetical protein
MADTCFLIVLSKIAGAFSCVRVVINGSLLADTNSAMADALNSPSARCTYIISDLTVKPCNIDGKKNARAGS